MVKERYILIITVNVNGLNLQPIQTDWIGTKTRPVSMLSTGDPL